MQENNETIQQIAWESICKRCGLCCFEKRLRPGGEFETTAIPCRYLDIVSRECRVYHKRFSADKTCVKLTPELVRAEDWLPKSCAYRILMKNNPETIDLALALQNQEAISS